MSQRQKIQLHNGCYIIPPVKELEVQPLMDQGLIQGARSVASNIGASFLWVLAKIYACISWLFQVVDLATVAISVTWQELKVKAYSQLPSYLYKSYA